MTDETEKRGPGRPAKEAAKILMTVLRDYWPADDERVRAGTPVECTAEEAMDGMEKGLLARVKA